MLCLLNNKNFWKCDFYLSFLFLASAFLLLRNRFSDYFIANFYDYFSKSYLLSALLMHEILLLTKILVFSVKLLNIFWSA